MAKEIYTRLGRPSTALLLLCFCLLAPLGWKAIMGADDGVNSGERILVASALPPSGLAVSVSPVSSTVAAVAALKGRTGGPSYLDTPATLPIPVGASWRYFKGISSAPPSAWKTVGFDDSTWLLGPSGFGYGDGDDATVLSDMQNPPNTPGYLSVYIRKEFNIPDLGSIAGVRLTIDYDDSYVVYVNGSEVARSSSMGGTVGTPPGYNTPAASNHEASSGSGGLAPDVIIIPSSALVAGTNVIAIQGHNGTLDSTDLSLIPRLEIELPPNAPPDAPANPVPADLATGLSTNPQLCVDVDDAEGTPLDVTFYGREASGVAGDPFTIIALPDTQFYSASFPATFNAQTVWIRDNRVARNIEFMTELGDCTDQGGIQAQWDNANAALGILENPITTFLPDGIPYGVAVGNHDQSPNGQARSGSDENITTTLYNQTLGKSRFSGRGYFGGQYPLPGFADSMDNHYELFSAGGMDFIAFHLEWDDTSCSWPTDGSAPTGTLTTCQNVLTWMRGLLTGAHANRRGMITTHFIGTPTGSGTGTPSFSTQGQAIFNSIKTLPNVFMLLGGHLDQADHRTDLATDGHPIHTVISDFQTRPNGGNGWLRIMTFDPQADTIHIETYSPNFDRFINKLNDGTPSSHADNLAPTENEITLGYDMDAGDPFMVAGTDTGVPAGLQACVNWPGRQVNTAYEWYAVASDGTSSTTGSRQSFTTTTSCSGNSECDDTDPCTDDTCNGSQLCEHAPVANCCLAAGDCDDSNVCTDEACTSNACVITNNNGPCTDGNACTLGDFCSGGSCAAGSAATCNDNNACTTDSCAAPTGCSNAYTPTAGCCSTAAHCDDGNAGTTDSCSSGTCVNQTNISCNTAAECNDSSVCTTDTCSGGNAAAISFSGSAGNRVQFPIGTGVDYLNDFGTGSFTIEGWVYTDGGAASLTSIFRAGRQQAFPQVTLQLTGTGNLQIAGSVETNAASTQVDVTGPALTANTWTHVAMVVDRTAGSQQLRVYVNGGTPTVATATLWATNPISWTTDASLLGVARDGTGALLNPFDGRLDEFRIWNHARTQAEISANMGSTITSAPGLVHRWGLNEGTGTTTADSVGSATGTLTTTTAPPPAWVTSPAQLPVVGAGICQHTTLSCDDGNVCTTDSCDSITGCIHPAGNEGGACNDVDDCTSFDLCSNGACAGLPNGTCCTTSAECFDGNTCTTDSCVISNTNAFSLAFDGVNDYVTMGVAAGLGASSFTLETWFNWTGSGVALSASGTGTGGLPTTTIPLFSKGAPEADTPANLNMNYFIGIVNGRLAGDFEDAATGLNHPVCTALSQPAISINTWHHAAATYDGTRWRLYLDGAELSVDTACSTCSGGACTVAPGATPESGSIQHFGLGTTLTSSGTAAGFFQGLLDEVRVWNVVRTQSDIQSNMNAEVLSASGLIGRWGFSAGTGTVAADSATPAENGTLTGGPTWQGTNKPALGEGTCQFPAATGASCDDTNLCLTGDTCDASGICQPGATPLNCNDSNVCTDDSCDNEQGCVNTINVAPCDDGSACTTGDTCDGGSCAGGAPLGCDDGDLCTTDSCSAATGCEHTPVVCNDGNSCTDDSCNAGTGCVFTPDNTNSCADADACNGLETCSAGACQAGTPPTCDDSNPCNGVETCNTGSGCVAGTPLNCDDLNPCTLDSCGPTGCVHETNTSICGDGDVCSTDTCTFAPTLGALAFDGVNDYVTMGASPGLGSTRYTLETWFKRTGAGSGNSTGTGGIASIVPLIAKGAPEADGSNLDADYIFGINTAGNVIAADFEDTATGGNHPISGTTPILNDTWYHAAATYDGTTWRLYLNGNLEATLVVGAFTPRADSIQHTGLGALLTSTGTRLGAFQGILDEARIWNYARSQADILGGRDRRIRSDLGLVGRWGLDQVSGTSAPDTTTPAEDGTLTGFTFVPTSGWVAGAPAFSTAECTYPNAPNGTTCDDAVLCTAPDQCTAGVCGGAAVPGCCLTGADCNDSNACTSDSCVSNTCDYAPIPGCTSCTTDAQCNDSNTCTSETCNTANDAVADLRGTTDYVNLGQDATANNFINNFGTSSFTIEGWFFADGFTTDLTSLFRAGRQGAFNQLVIQLRTGPYISASVEASPSAQVDTPNTAATITLSQWHHVAMVIDRTLATPQVRIYLNGNLAGSVNTTWTGSTVVNMPAGDATLLGATRDTAGALINNYNGRLDEWRIWNYARTQAEIQNDRTKEIVSATGLVHRWGFNEASGNAIDDPGTFDGVMTSGATRLTTNLPVFGNDLCVFAAANNGSTCNDANACTVSTTCSAGVCGGGSAENCDDSNLCTTDTCDAGTGCGHAPVVCSPGFACSPATGLCVSTCTPTGTDQDCDNIDQDCDGTADDGFVPTATSCGQGVCVAAGSTTCTAGVTGNTCVAGSPTGSDQDCDNIDQDCDGTADDGFVPTATSCGQGVCAAAGSTTCTAGATGNTCVAGSPTGSDQDCDNIDQDCDGTADDGFVPTATSCGQGVCASSGSTTCTAGVTGNTCVAGSPTGSDQDCDNIDQDCDGTADDGFVPTATSCGQGVCAAAGSTTCTAGVTGNTCVAGSPTGSDQDCDNIDQDCDGTADDGFVSTATSCGQGVCASSGSTTCTAGVTGNTCVAGSPTGTDQDCDNIDQDCDGTADDGFVSTATSCGQGVCASSGSTTCTAGATGNTCVAGSPTGSDQDCDNIDQDCDGTADDGFVSTATSCGQGVCASSGSTTCTAGATGNTCVAGSPTGSDQDCDNIDQDCDGTADDGFVSTATSCGQGVCASSGSTTCTAGATGNTCVAGSPTGSDQDCDNIDQDCDGTADDGFVPTATSCGQGVCASSGSTTCTAGATGNTCVAGSPTGSDQDCDNIDQDCDGTADDGFVPTATSCGQGVCAAAGSTTCTAGATGNTCVPGSPTIEVCNGLDDDCNGLADEGVCAGDLGGTLTYYRDGNASLEPSSRGVSGIAVNLTGTGSGAPDSVSSSSTGSYAFVGKPLNQNYTIQPGRNGSFAGAITSFDAALVARRAVGLISLTPNQELAADTSGNGTILSLDASYIAQIAAGLATQTPVGATVGSDWFMVPAPTAAPNQTVTPPAIPPGVNGSISYSPLAATANGQDFLTGLFGDVSGNWSNIAPMALRLGDEYSAIQSLAASKNGPAARLSLVSGVAVQGELVEITIRAQGASQAISFDLDLGYDANLLTPEGVRVGSAAGSFTVTPNMTTPGRVRLSLFSAETFGGSGDLVVVTFRVRAGSRGVSRMTLAGFIDEGSMPLSIGNGSLRIRKQR